MHEILFRGKAINRDCDFHRTNYKNGDWVYGLVTRIYDDRFENLPAEMTNIDGISGIEIDYKTIGQFTGLTDKNGNKIFEGDILKATLLPLTNKKYVLGKVIFENGTFKLSIIGHMKNGNFSLITNLDKTYKKTNKFAIENNFIFRNYVLEIIGNVYDNPELLKEGEDK